MTVLAGPDPLLLVRDMWSYPFMVSAFRAGTVVAVLAGVVGWFMVLRRQSFAGHALATAAFPGGAGAELVGLSATAGAVAFCVVTALVLGLAGFDRGPEGGRGHGDGPAVTGTVLAVALACGFLFTTLHHGSSGGVNALLFGTFLGVTPAQVAVLAAVALAALTVLGVIARPLLYASVEPTVARARGVPTRALGTVFLVLLGLAAAAASQITGTLLVFALLVMPAATARTLTARPGRGVALTVLLAVALTWTALTVAFHVPYPVGFVLTTLAFGAYVAARLVRELRDRAGRRVRAGVAG